MGPARCFLSHVANVPDANASRSPTMGVPAYVSVTAAAVVMGVVLQGSATAAIAWRAAGLATVPGGDSSIWSLGLVG